MKPLATSSETTAPLAVTNVSVQPGLSDDGFVGAASDVTTKHCMKVDAGWEADGTVKNSSGANATYRIYVAFNKKDTTDTLALAQTDVSVANGKSATWTAAGTVGDDDLVCVLRVERTKTK